MSQPPLPGSMAPPPAPPDPSAQPLMFGGGAGLLLGFVILCIALCIGLYICTGAVLTGGGADFDRDMAPARVTGWGLACLSVVFGLPGAACLALGLRRR